MNAAHLHLLVNHLPVILPPLGLLLLLCARLRGSDDIRQAAMGVFVLGALLAVPAYYSGEPAEERVEDLPGVAKSLIHEHEESAEWAAGAIGILGVLAAPALILLARRRRVPAPLRAAVLVAALLTAVVMGRTALLGGRIHHPEIREPAASTPEARQAED